MKDAKSTISMLALGAMLASGLAMAVGVPDWTGHFLVRAVRAIMAGKPTADSKKQAAVAKPKSKADLTKLSKKFTVIDQITDESGKVDEESLKGELLEAVNKQLKEDLKDLMDSPFDMNFLTGSIMSCYTVKGYLKDTKGLSLPGVSQDAVDFASGVYSHGLDGFGQYAVSLSHLGNQSFYMSGGGGGEWYGYVSYSGAPSQSGSSEATSITMTEHYVDSSDNSTMTIETRHGNGVTTQTVTHTDKDGNVTTETSTDGSGGSDSGSSSGSSSGSGDDTPAGKPHPDHPLVAAAISKISATQVKALHNNLWLKIKKGATFDPSPIDTEPEMTQMILNAKKVSGLGNNPCIDYGPEKIRPMVVEKKLKLDPKKIVDPVPTK